MHTHLECLGCLLGQITAAAQRLDLDPAVTERAMRAAMGYLQRADFCLPPPVQAQKIYALLGEELGQADPFEAVRRDFNNRVLALLPAMEQRVRDSPDPFRTAVKLALAGNIIDLGVVHSFDLEETIERVLDTEPAVDDVELLRTGLQRAERILYLADNAGEIVFDRLLLDQLPSDREITLVARGGPVINDVTTDDLAQAGLRDRPGRLRVIDSGVDIPGTWLDACGAALRRAMADADLIISKGQGNYETLHAQEGYPIFFLFMLKCDVVSRYMGLDKGATMVAFHESLRNI